MDEVTKLEEQLAAAKRVAIFMERTIAELEGRLANLRAGEPSGYQKRLFTIVELRSNGLTFREIAKRVGLSESNPGYISSMHKAGLRLMKKLSAD